MDAQLTGTNGPDARKLRSCRARATSSLPVPDSPCSNTVLLTAATRPNDCDRAVITGELPTRLWLDPLRADRVCLST